eukprot:264266-Chlamydomonas_euryale.AAC.3
MRPWCTRQCALAQALRLPWRRHRGGPGTGIGAAERKPAATARSAAGTLLWLAHAVLRCVEDPLYRRALTLKTFSSHLTRFPHTAHCERGTA